MLRAPMANYSVVVAIGYSKSRVGQYAGNALVLCIIRFNTYYT